MEDDKKKRKFLERLDRKNPHVIARIILDEEEPEFKEGNIILLSLVNQEMLETDIEFHEEMKKGNKDYYYIPYVYGFMVEVSGENKRTLEYLREFSNSYISCKLVDTDSVSDNLKSTTVHWLDGFTFFSASPFIYTRQTLLISEINENPELMNGLNSEAERFIEELRNIPLYGDTSRLGEYMPSSNAAGKIKVFNVGQASCSYLKSKTHRIMLDIGVDKTWLYKQAAKKDAPVVISQNYNHIHQCKPKAVILSHWDTDHILGVCLLDKEFPELWVAPDIFERGENIPLGTARLFCYLHHTKRLLSVPKCYNNNVFFDDPTSSLSIYKGNAEKRNIRNNHGLIVLVGNKDEKIIFPGDCEYEAWPRSLDIAENIYPVLIAPHHGAKMPLKDSVAALQLDKRKTAIFSYGENNQYGHPSGEHVLRLANRYGYDVLGTAEHRCIEIVFNLHADIKFQVIPHPREVLR